MSNDKKKTDSKTVLKYSDSILSTIVLLTAIALLTTLKMDMEEHTVLVNTDIRSLRFSVAGLFAMMSVTRVLQALYARGNNKFSFTNGAVYVGFYAVAVLISLLSPGFLTALPAVLEIYLASLLAGRIVGMVYNRSILSLVKNILGIIVIAPAMIIVLLLEREYEAPFIGIIAILVTMQYLLRVVIISFSQIKLDILRKIIRKTYGAEVLFGLVLLITAVSGVLKAMEPGFDSYGDALWYCFAIVTTIGFGDITAVSFPGRLLSVILGIYGIIVVSLITSIIINFYSETKDSPDDEEEKIETGDNEC